MSRDATPYDQMTGGAARGGIDVSKPVEGYYLHRLRKGSVTVAVHIYYGPPLDPVTGERLDRSWRWQADVNGRPGDFFHRVWPACAGNQISESLYRRYCRRLEWAEQNAPDSAYAKPGAKIDLLSTKTPTTF